MSSKWDLTLMVEIWLYDIIEKHTVMRGGGGGGEL